MKRAIVVFSVLVIVFAGLLSQQLGNLQAGSDMITDTSDMGYEYYDGEGLTKETAAVKTTPTPTPTPKLIKVDTKEDSVTVLVNRQYRLSENYIPADLVVPSVRFSFYGTYEKSYVRQVASDALEKLFAAGASQNVNLRTVSGYRSYARQKEIYNRNVASRGKEKTDLVSAMPGSSEHQTGLSIDVSSDDVGCALEESFGDTTEGKWLAQNCHKYGFIIRYPKGKSDITGYSYEPWHIRYVGKKLATYLHKKGLTLEEYYETTTVDQQIKDSGEEIRDVAEDENNEQEMKTAPTPKPGYTASTTTRTDQTSATIVTKAPAATRKPVSTRRPASKATHKPAAKTPATAKPQISAQEPKETTASEEEQTPSGQTQDTSTAIQQEDTTKVEQQTDSTPTENVEEEIDLNQEQ